MNAFSQQLSWDQETKLSWGAGLKLYENNKNSSMLIICEADGNKLKVT